LHARLADEQPVHLRVLHRRASAWYERNGEPSEAIRHALAAEDFHQAAELVEVAVPSLRRNRQEATALGWLNALPDELVNVRPVLSATYAWALLACGELEGVMARLDGAERWLDTTTDMAGVGERPKGRSAEMVVVDEAEFRRLPGAIAVSRAAHALALGNVAETMIYARHARDLVSEDDHLGRGAASALLGLASWTMGDLEAAHAAYAASKASLQMAGHLSDVLGCAIVLADIRIAQGRLHDAMRTY
jgi:LuxR family maltose regulon positive regulatory protein